MRYNSRTEHQQHNILQMGPRRIARYKDRSVSLYFSVTHLSSKEKNHGEKSLCAMQVLSYVVPAQSLAKTRDAINIKERKHILNWHLCDAVVIQIRTVGKGSMDVRKSGGQIFPITSDT